MEVFIFFHNLHIGPVFPVLMDFQYWLLSYLTVKSVFCVAVGEDKILRTGG